MQKLDELLAIFMRVKAHPSLQNAAWTILEKVVAGFGVLLVTAYVARYIGPSLVGQLTMAAAVFQVVLVAAQLGSDSVLFKRVSRNAVSGARLLSATTGLRLGVYLAISVPVLAFFLDGQGRVESVFFVATCVAGFFAAWDVYSIYNNARLWSRVNAIANLIGLVCGLGSRYIIGAFKIDPVFLAFPIVMTAFVPFLIRYWIFRGEAGAKISSFHVRRYSRHLLGAGGAVMISAVAVALYTKIGQFVVFAVEGDRVMGVYSAALTIATSWAFVNVALINSFFPQIFAERDENRALNMAARLGRYIAIICICVTLLFYLFGEFAISLLFGPDFSGAYAPGVVLCLSVMFSALGTISSRYVVRLSGYRYLLVKTLAVLCFSLLVYYPLVHFFGGLGGAIGVLLVELVSLTLMNYFFREGIVLRLHRRIVGV